MAAPARRRLSGDEERGRARGIGVRARQHGLSLAVARPTAIYGPGDLRLLKLFSLIAKRRFIILGDGEIFYHLVYVDDLVRGFRLLATSPAAAGDVFILGGAEYRSLNDLGAMIARIVHAPPPRIKLPAWPFQMAGSVVERVCKPLGIAPPIYRRRVDFFTKSRAFTIEKARRVLGYEPQVPLEEGLARTARWYQEHGYLPAVQHGGVSASRGTARPQRETADVETASEDYARRFAGPVGAWFLSEQAGRRSD